MQIPSAAKKLTKEELEASSQLSQAISSEILAVINKYPDVPLGVLLVALGAIVGTCAYTTTAPNQYIRDVGVVARDCVRNGFKSLH